MKKEQIKQIILDILFATVVFWLSYAVRLAAVFGIGTLSRAVFKEGSIGEYGWMAAVTVIVTVIVCIMKTTLASGEDRRLYIKDLGEGEWTMKHAWRYNLRSPRFWITAGVVSVWAACIPSFREAGNRFMFAWLHESVRESPFGMVLALFSFVLPFLALYLLMLAFIDRKWAKERIRHYEQQKKE